jgi:hypothetical protein
MHASCRARQWRKRKRKGQRIEIQVVGRGGPFFFCFLFFFCRRGTGTDGPRGFFLPTGEVKPPASGSGLPVWFDRKSVTTS